MSDRPRASENNVPLIEGGSLGLVRLLLQRRSLLWRYPLAITVLVLAIAFLFPNVYRSTVAVLPPERDFQSLGQSTSDIKNVITGGLALPMMATPSDILAAVLTSRSVADSTVKHLKLAERWDLQPADALKRLRAGSGAKVAPTGIIEFWVEDKSRWFADTTANTMVSLADRINQSIVNTKASRTRQFVEQRLTETRAQLDSAASVLEAFQKEHRTIALDVEVKAMLENAALLRAQKTADEIELSVLRESLSPDHPRIRALNSRIVQTEQKLADMESPDAMDTTSAGFLNASLVALPGLTQELAVRIRDVKVAEVLYELLTQQYEHARIQERRDTPTFSVLDPAAGGGVKVRPKRLWIGLGTLLTALLFACSYVVLSSYLSRLAVADPARHESILALWYIVFPRHSRRRQETTS